LDENHPNVKKGLPFHGANPFLPSMPGLKADTLAWLREMDRVGGMVSMLIADSLGLDRNFFGKGMCNDHLGTLGLFHYPPFNYKEDDWGVREHTDYGFLTILMFDQPRL
jgi:isopenicillin N synthase-like dioxygenase